MRPTDPAGAVTLLDDALARWHNGPPFTELTDVEGARPELERLEEWRVRAVEERAAALHRHRPGGRCRDRPLDPR